MKRSSASLQHDLIYGHLDKNHAPAGLENPRLIHNDDSSMLAALRTELETADRFLFSVAFVSEDGLGMLRQQLVNFRGTGTIVTSTYLDFNTPDALRDLIALRNIRVRVIEDHAHHAKGYVFDHGDHVTAIIGSSNLTRHALISNEEWNLQFSTHRDGDIADQLNRAIHRQISHSVRLTHEWVDEYEKSRQQRVILTREDDSLIEVSPAGEKILPNAMQTEALENLQSVIDSGHKRAIVISATGTGKTILSAFAAQKLNPGKMLFVAHREQILRKAAEEFQRVFRCESSEIGIFAGSRRQTDRRFVFATVQLLSKKDYLTVLSPRLFDLVIVDEAHRAGSESYRAIIDHFRPGFLLGLTATPERTDGFNVFELFDYNVAYEIRLERAMEERMLVPFDYYGVADCTSPGGGSLGGFSGLSDLVAPERVHHIVNTLGDYSFARGTKGLIFCTSNTEATALAEQLNLHRVHGRRLRTLALSGSTSVEKREAAVRQLEDGKLDYLLTVDIFNEGIDIPAVNVVVLLRSTESAIVFTQQLGRGLRKAKKKTSLRVIDFIGNYANNYLIPIALTGDRSGSKDSVRDRLAATRHNAVAGGSTISFDRISTQRVIEALGKARLDGRREKRDAIAQLQFRLGTIPRLLDFETHNSLDPVVLAATDGKARNYWSLLHALKIVDEAPSASEAEFLNLVTQEFLNGKRPQELLLLRELLARRTVTRSECDALFGKHGVSANEFVCDTIARIFDLSWFPETGRKPFGNEGIASYDGKAFTINPHLHQLYLSYSQGHPEPSISFRAHLDDLIETGLHLNRARYQAGDQLIPGCMYTRKDVCRLLNWDKNNESTIYGYMTDKKTMTCPIFVTYHKDSDLPANLRYEDKLIDTSTMHWFSRSKRKLTSGEIRPIVSGEADLFLFVKREDSDGTNFHFLGKVHASDAKQTTKVSGDLGQVDIVSANLILEAPISQELFDRITTPTTDAAPTSRS
ncbi:type I restriction enzyme EcoKI subunit R [Corynebacterium capitovis DSM 44611]|uniref:DEAD/DEAH box helicase n=1 Tax=Corynebacterium capitovis TaxID=131081 RepID=UPI000363B619|nr:DEAD/DEAH box helicase [Corynebacterium capitovis]WKD56680.1 type I restriction enzyme EcoKI subunit R [Corynebacterium capitovis DSM 44611]